MANKGRFYITSALYYVNDVPHLGHAFEILGIDIQARFRRLIGHEVFFLTGTDEHGQKIANVAESKGLSPKDYADQLVEVFKEVFARLKISYDDFIRTTDERHHKAVDKIWRACMENGDIYLGKYEGWYDVKEESYISEAEKDEIIEKAKAAGRPDPMGTRIKRMSEDAFFFKLSRFQDQIRDHIQKNPDFAAPETRKNEVLNSFLKNTPDLCISRSTLKWGIPVPDEPGHVIWVWFDALTNYITGVGYGHDEESFSKLWPADVHVIGKDISKFHCVIWPGMLMSAGVQPPKQVFSHGFIEVLKPGQTQGEKMSKSAGNSITADHYIEKIGLEPLRYILFREINYGSDGTLNEEAMSDRYNGDLAGNLGNLLSRTTNMVEKYLDAEVKAPRESLLTGIEKDIAAAWAATVAEYERGMPKFEYHLVLAKMWEFLDLLNRAINDVAPWALAKDESKKDQLALFLATIIEGLRGIALLITPFMPETAEKIQQSLGIEKEPEWETAKLWAVSHETLKVKKGDALFPRLES